MTAKLKDTARPRADPDEAPELTDTDFSRGVWTVAGKEVSAEAGQPAMQAAVARGRPKAESPKLALTVRYDAEVVAAFKATGKGWQTRMNAALRDWLKTHSPA